MCPSHLFSSFIEKGLFNFIIYSKCISKRLHSSRLEPTHPSSHPKFTEYDTHTLPTELFRLAFRVQWNATCRWYLVIPLYTYSTRIVKHLFYTNNNTDCFYDERIRYMPLYVGCNVMSACYFDNMFFFSIENYIYLRIFEMVTWW